MSNKINNDLYQETRVSVVVPCYNESASIERQLSALANQVDDMGKSLPSRFFEVIIVDNNSTDESIAIVHRVTERFPAAQIVVVDEPRKGVSMARIRGFSESLSRNAARNSRREVQQDILVLSTDADCEVAPDWIFQLFAVMTNSNSHLAISNYYFADDAFLEERPRLSQVVQKIMQARDLLNRLFGGFPDGKGFAVWGADYQETGGIDPFYQLVDGRFAPHPSDDWDFGIKLRACGKNIVYAEKSRVKTNPRRLQFGLEEMVNGNTYGRDGILTMRDIRHADTKDDLSTHDAAVLWDYSIKDLVHKYVILPLLLTPKHFQSSEVRRFLSDDLCDQLQKRISEVTEETRLKDFTVIHTFKTPCYRIYFEFYDQILARLVVALGHRFASLPPLPLALQEIRERADDILEWQKFVFFYCEDRESGEAHNYFGNGGVF